MPVDYDYERNLHTIEGPEAAIPQIFKALPRSLLDVGCGMGGWIAAARRQGVVEVLGVDGATIDPGKLAVPAEYFCHQDLTQPWSLGREFDVALCLEVGEHLAECHAAGLIDALVAHSALIVFSAAIPGQGGQHHVNCQWPTYWQNLFNQRGYVCADDLRWEIWDDERIEPWYRQNMFSARRDAARAGREPRIRSVVHPAMHQLVLTNDEPGSFAERLRRIEDGRMPMSWYLTAPFAAVGRKARRWGAR